MRHRRRGRWRTRGSWKPFSPLRTRGAGEDSRGELLNFQQPGIKSRVLSSSAATDLAPFEGDLRSTFGAAHAELPVRALQFARAAASAAGREDSLERALAVANLLLIQGADPEPIAAPLICQAMPAGDPALAPRQAVSGNQPAMLPRGPAR